MKEIDHITITETNGNVEITIYNTDGTKVAATKSLLYAIRSVAANEFETYSNVLCKITGRYLNEHKELNTGYREGMELYKMQHEIGKLAGIHECSVLVSDLALKAHEIMQSADRALALISK